VPTE